MIMGIEVRNIDKSFGNFSALKDINLSVPTGELVALLGPSGSGKTTLLRIIAGLEVPDSGAIYFHGEDTTDQRVQERKVGFVFQHYALFKQMTVFENIAFGLRVQPRSKRFSEKEIKTKVNDLLRLVQMEWLAERYPAQLSGGQRQRIALARALAVEPKVLLLDEPFGALDAKVRKELRRWLRHLHDKIHITSIFVTHDQDEALEVADQVVIMNEGRIEQIGTPETVYDHPANLFVYKFLGNVNLFRGRISEGQVHIGANVFDLPACETNSNANAVAYARPYELEIDRQQNDITNIQATILYLRAIGPVVRLELKRTDNDDLIDAELTKERYRAQTFQVGETVFIGLRNPRLFVEDYSI
jgi:sulfate/thiosulfate transport system ATP-binding protein